MSKHAGYSRCKRCGDFEGPISSRGLCRTCAIAGARDAIRAMAYREGRTYERWRTQMIAFHRRALAELLMEELPRVGHDMEVQPCSQVDGRRPTW